MSDPQMDHRIKSPPPRLPPSHPKPAAKKQEVNSRTPLVRSYERITDTVTGPKNQQRSKSIDRWYSTPQTQRPRPTIITSNVPAVSVATSIAPPSAIRIPCARRESETKTSPSMSQGATPSSPTGSDRPRARFSQFISSLSNWRSGSKSVGGVEEKGGSRPGSGGGSSANTPLSSPHPRSYPASVVPPPSRRGGKGQVMRRSEEALRYHTRGPFPVHQSTSLWSASQQQQQAHQHLVQCQHPQGRYPQHVYSQNYHNHQHPYNPPAQVGGSSSRVVLGGGGGGSPFNGSGPSNASGMFTAARRASSWGYEGFDNSEYVDVVSLRSDRIELNDHEMIVGAGGVSNDLQALMPRSLSAGLAGVVGVGVGGGGGGGVGAGGVGAGQLCSAARSIVAPVRENGRVSFYGEAERAQFGPPGFDEDSSTIASGSVCGSSSGNSSGVWQRGSGMFEEEEEEEGGGDDDVDAVLGAPREVVEQRPRDKQNGKSREGGEEYNEDNGDSDDDDNHVTFAPKRRGALASS